MFWARLGAGPISSSPSFQELVVELDGSCFARLDRKAERFGLRLIYREERSPRHCSVLGVAYRYTIQVSLILRLLTPRPTTLNHLVHML